MSWSSPRGVRLSFAILILAARLSCGRHHATPCESVCGSQDMASALAHVVKNFGNIFLNVFVAFQGEIDSCLLQSLWADDIPFRVTSEVTSEVMSEVTSQQRWWSHVQKLTYADSSQQILVGDVTWMTDVMKKVNAFYNDFRLNAEKTRWIWVVQECSSAKIQNIFSSGVPAPLPPSPSFPEILQIFSEVLLENMEGVLLGDSHKAFVNQESTQPRRWVNLGAIERGGDGSSQLVLAASWSTDGLRSYKPLWPEPPFNFLNRTVRIACIQKPQVFEFDDNHLDLQTAGGYIVDLLRIMQSHLNFTGVLVPTDGFGLSMPNGSYNGMVGVVQRKEAEMAALDFTPDHARTQVVDFSLPIGDDIVVIISRAPDVIMKPFLLLQIFSPLSWISIVAGAAGVGLASYVMGRVESLVGVPDGGRSISLKHQVASSLKIHVYQGSKVKVVGGGARFVGLSGMIVALIIGSLYSGSITAFLAIPFRSLPVDSTEDLVRSTIRPALRSKTLVLQTLTAEGGALYDVRDKVGVFTGAETSSWEFFKTVAKGKFALVDVYSSAVGRAMKYERRGERCQFYLGKEPVKVDLDVFVFAKNSPIRFQFDEMIRWLKYFGIIDHIKRKYYSVPCEAEITSNAPKAMSLRQSQGAFYVLGSGLVLAATSFLLEVLSRTFRKEDEMEK